MKKNLLPVVALAAVALPQVASAQAIAPAVVAVADLQRASSQCNACKSALTALESQVNGLKSLQTSLETPLRTEATAIQTAINGLAGKQPDAALTARIQAFEKKQQDAQRQLATRQQTFERNRAYVLQQIGQKLDPSLASVMQKRGATVILDSGNVAKYSPAVDVTADVIAALNVNIKTLSTTAPAQPAPQGR